MNWRPTQVPGWYLDPSGWAGGEAGYPLQREVARVQDQAFWVLLNRQVAVSINWESLRRALG